MPVNQIDESPAAIRYDIRLVCEGFEFLSEHFYLTGEMYGKAEEEAARDTLTCTYHTRLNNLDSKDRYVL